MKNALAMCGLLAAVVAGMVGGCSSANSSSRVETNGFHSAKTLLVGTLGELQNAINTAVPGEEIVLAQGTYVSDGPITINCAGKPGNPVLIRAQGVGEVEITGKAGFTFGASAQWVALQGFTFTHSSATMMLPAGTKFLRITRNEFAPKNDALKHTMASTIEMSGDDCEVDHNYFHDKATEGCWVTVQGPGHDEMAQRAWIHHNEFKNFMPSENNCSAIQVGLSSRSLHSGFALVEHNLFIKCRGENEGMVCNKSCDNVYRYNTITDGTRELSLRHGNRCVVYGNYFLHVDGLRFFGHDHRIYSNYFEVCEHAINIGNGDGIVPADKLTSHDKPVGEVVAFNTLVNNRVDITEGDRKNGLGAADVTVANNVIVGGPKAADIQGKLENPTWARNFVWNTGMGDLPKGSYVVMDPQLSQGADGIWRPGMGSPVIGQAVGEFPYVMVDVDGRSRGGAKDVGASQVNGGPVSNRVLTEKDVGPAAP